MIHRNEPLRAVFFTLLVVALALGWGCGTTRTAELDRAQAAYNQAQADPVVARNASVPLYEAGQSLQQAEKAKNKEEQRHYAYISEKQTEQAVAQSRQKVAEQNTASLSEKRQQIVIQSREQEAARARQQAQQSQQQAQTSQQQAQAARQQALMAEQRALAAQQQAAAAKGEAQAAAEQERLAREQSSQLENQLSELQAKQTNQGNVVMTLGDVMFETNRATLAPGAMLSLDKLANILKQNPNEKVFIEGHTDNTGTAAYNQQLSQQRAEAVRSALMSRGISPDRIIARGMGESFPVATNNNAAGRQQNRRVEVVVTG